MILDSSLQEPNGRILKGIALTNIVGGFWETGGPIEELWSELGTRALAEGETRCAQPPYNRIPLARAEIPEEIILSREVDSFIREETVLTCFKDGRLFRFMGKNDWSV